MQAYAAPTPRVTWVVGLSTTIGGSAIYMSAHAPHEHRPRDERDAFWDLMSATLQGVRARFPRARTYVLIDANGRTGLDLPHIGNNDPGVTNQNGAAFIAFLQAHDLRAENTFWPVGHTWRAPHRGSTAPIDYICVDLELPDV